ncbi:hypothetical protein BD779DRAFT_1099467 [Infundibulicybe gibba]|nr:hypothetical protein BD779DRAFT_1099467 [Infundibulicybe gibba]
MASSTSVYIPRSAGRPWAAPLLFTLLALILIHYMTTLPRRVIVDDVDPQIQYSGVGWQTTFPRPDAQPNGLPFQNTTHYCETAASLSIQFQGSSPQVFGTSESGIENSYECFIDGTSIGSTAAAPIFENNNLLCDGALFVEGKEYTLTLNLGQTSLPNPLWFDYVTYIPSISVPLGSATVLVDRLDPAIEYVDAVMGVWTRDSLGTSTQGNGSSLVFDFTGTSVSWVGFTPQMPSGRPTSNATYSIDKANPVVFRLPSGSPGENLTNQVFFTSPTLSPGSHSLEVTYKGNSAMPPLTLSYLIVTNNVSETSQPPTVSSTATTSTNKPSVPTTSINKPSVPTPIGAIIGGVIGGIALFCLVAFFLRRRSRQWKTGRKGFGTDHDDTATLPHLTPFDVMPSEPAMAEARNRVPKTHHFSMVDPPEFDPYLPLALDRPSGIGGVDATPRAQNLNHRQPSLLAPPVETVREDRGARSATTDEAVNPPPSYAS